jgi:hypothetical protein
MENKKNENQEENPTQESNKVGRNWDPNKKMDIDPNMGGPFAYSENQENESVYTIPDANLNPASRNAKDLIEGMDENNDEQENNQKE